MKHLLIPLLILPTPISAAQVDLWHGPTDRACDNRCEMGWALSEIRDIMGDDYDRLLEAMRDEPTAYMVEDGDVFRGMSYYDGEPLMDKGMLVAALNEPEPATGWVIDDWAFIKIHGCTNWALIHRGDPSLPVLSPPIWTYAPPPTMALFPPIFYGDPPPTIVTTTPPPIFSDPPDNPPITPGDDPPPIIPLGPTWVYLVVAIILGARYARTNV